MCISDLFCHIVINLNNISSAGCEMLFIICKQNETKEKIGGLGRNTSLLYFVHILRIFGECNNNRKGTGLNDKASQMENMCDTS